VAELPVPLVPEERALPGRALEELVQVLDDAASQNGAIRRRPHSRPARIMLRAHESSLPGPPRCQAHRAQGTPRRVPLRSATQALDDAQSDHLLGLTARPASCKQTAVLVGLPLSDTPRYCSILTRASYGWRARSVRPRRPLRSGPRAARPDVTTLAQASWHAQAHSSHLTVIQSASRAPVTSQGLPARSGRQVLELGHAENTGLSLPNSKGRSPR
jgi:hypothetical protein